MRGKERVMGKLRERWAWWSQGKCGLEIKNLAPPEGQLPRSVYKSLSHLDLSQGGIQKRQWHPTPVLLPGNSHGRKSLIGFGPWGLEESDTTEQLHFHFSLSCIGEGNGNPLQCSCLENPRDGGAWWATVHGVAKSWIQLSDLACMHTRTT